MLLERRPISKVLSREGEPDRSHADLIGNKFRQCISECQILQTAIADILKITVARHCKLTVGTESHISSRTRQVSVRIVFAPDLLMEILWDKCSIRTGIWTIEQHIVGSRSPIHLTYTLEEYSEIKAEVLETQVYAVVVSWLIVSNDSAVTRIIHGVLSLIDNSVTIQVKELDISSVKSAFIAGS